MGFASGKPGCGGTPYAKRAMVIDAVGNSFVTGCSGNGANTDYLTVKYDPSGAVLWSARYNGTGNGSDQAYALVLDANDNVVVTGFSLGSSGSFDYVTIKYDSAGTQLWIRSYNGADNDIDAAYAVAVDSSGNVLVTGNSRSSGSSDDYATVKYSSSGVQLWVATYNGTGNGADLAFGLAIDANDNVVITGQSVGNGGDDDYATVKYSSSGAQLWAVTYNGTGNGADQAHALAVDPSGNVMVTGTAYDSIGGNNYATVKYSSSNGAQLWVATYSGSGNGFDLADVVAVDTGGNVLVTGQSQVSGTNSDYATVKYNSSGVQLWAATHDGTGNSTDIATALAVDAGGNVLVTGFTRDGSGSYDYATIKYDSAGAQLWLKAFDGASSGSDQAYAVAVDASGNVFVTGHTFGSGNYHYATVKYNSAGVQLWVSGALGESQRNEVLAFRQGVRKMFVDATGNTYVVGIGFNGQNDDYRIFKFDGAGALVWSATYDGSGKNADVASALAVDASGNVIVTGRSINSSGSADYATVKYNSAGAQLWVATHNGTSNNSDYATALAVDSSGNVYVTGYASDSLLGNVYTTIKYNSAGAPLWVKTYGTTVNNTNQANALAVDASGNVYVTGRSVGSSGGSNYATIKYDALGTQLWVAIYNGAGNDTDVANALAVDASGNVYVTGYSRGISDGDNYATIKYDALGVQLWVATYNGTGNNTDQANALVVDGNGNVIVTGRSRTNSGSDDYATVKYSTAGVEQWVTTYNGTANSDDQANALAVDASGNVTVTGNARSSSGNYDFVTVKYDSAGTPTWVHRYDGVRGLGDAARAVVVEAGGRTTIAGTVNEGSGYSRIGVVRISVGYVVTASAGANGGITPGSQVVATGGDVQFSVTPSTGYRVSGVSGSTCSPIDMGGGIWKASNITQDCTVSASFANAAPNIGVVANQVILEDSAASVVTVVVSDLETDPVQLQLTAESSNTNLIPNPIIGVTANPNQRSLSFAPVNNWSGGPVTMTLNATDSGGANFQRTFAISVTPVNDAPSLLLGTSPTHPASTTGTQSVPGFASVDFGPADEDATQAVADFLIDSVIDPDGILLASSLDIADNRTLSYTLTGIGGTATITTRVRDNGGTLNSGIDTSSAKQFTIQVIPGADLQVAKTNNRGTLPDGVTTVYAIVVANSGPNAVTGARLVDTLPSTLINGSWICVPASSNASCPIPGANNGNLDVLINLGINQYLRFDVMAEVDGQIDAQVINTATVTAPNGTTALNIGNDSATDTDLIVPVGIFISGFEAQPAGILTVPGAAEALAD